MWDRSKSKTFTESEALAYQGKMVKTSAGCVATVKGMFCEGPNRYTLTDERGNTLYKQHNNCVYIVGCL